jgi:dinuclear metal center YbgI/SA1388 family protein
MTRIKDLLYLIDVLAPWRLAEDWDNSGLMVGRMDAPARRVALALDPTAAAISRAHESGADVLLTHHPLIFRPLKQVNLDHETGAAVARAIQLGISVVSAHTNLDAALQGVPRALADRLGLVDVQVLDPVATMGEGEGDRPGFGAIGKLNSPLFFNELITVIKEKLQVSGVRFAAAPNHSLQTIALLPGSGGSYIQQAKSRGADVLLTGDASYHDARLAEHLGLGLIDAGHFATERPILEPLAAGLARLAIEASLDITFGPLIAQTDPWTMA